MAITIAGAFEILLALQATQATVTGVVRDARSSEPLEGAVVVLTDLERAAMTGADGRYVFRDVPAGPQHLAVQRIGYADRTLHALVPRQGELGINVSLRSEPIALDGLEARPAVAVRGLDGADATSLGDRRISISAIRNHPLLAEPDVFQALGGGEVAMRPESPGGLHVRSGASDQTAFLLDGIPVISPYHANGVFSAWNPDAISSLDLRSVLPVPGSPDALSGVVTAVTRTPGRRLGTQGGVSTTHARLTLDGPMGAAGGWLFSIRTSYPGLISPRDEASYLRGEAGDWLLKLETKALGGRLELLGYDNTNESDAAAAVEGAAGDAARNAFEWRSRSIGVSWLHPGGAVAWRLRAWHAAGGASATWSLDAERFADLTSDRRDAGLSVTVEQRSGSGRSTSGGFRVEHIRTSYALASDEAVGSWALTGGTSVGSAFIQHAGSIGARLEYELGTSVTAAAGALHPGPRAQLRWNPSDRLAFSGSWSRRHQFVQSLRNRESVVGNIFPADLWVGSSLPGVPVGRSDVGVVVAEYRPAAGIRLSAQAYDRDFDGLLLVAPRGGEPFSTGEYAIGSGTARGIALDAAMNGARYGVGAGWGWQRVRFSDRSVRYVPDHGAAHSVETGIIVFPTRTSSIRAGVTGIFGRRTTPVPGELEWESCNLVDLGCEFSGSPHYGTQIPGSATLPGYVRVDVGVRKHWHIGIAGRDASLAFFGVVTNVFGHSNVLTWTADPATGDRLPVEMRPRAPLVVGLDWRF